MAEAICGCRDLLRLLRYRQLLHCLQNMSTSVHNPRMQLDKQELTYKLDRSLRYGARNRVVGKRESMFPACHMI
jgi:hypothetical protein